MPQDLVREAQLAELRKVWAKLENSSANLLEPNQALLMPEQLRRQTTSPIPPGASVPLNPAPSAPNSTATAPRGLAGPAPSSSSLISSAPPPPPTAAATATATTAANSNSAAAAAASLGVSRRTHPKSRTGCRTCKIRKIKCDEERPSCRNCIKHGVNCPYTTPSSSATTPSGTLSATASPIPIPSHLPHGLGSLHGDHELNLVDLELLHNFTTSTYATLSSDPGVRDVWRINVVRFGVQCEYVMRSILAVSALHIAHHKPQKRDFYFSRALAYHQMASRAATPLMSNLATSSEGWEYLYLFSTLTIFFSLGSTKHADVLHSEAFPPWIYLLNGSKSLIHLVWLRIEEYEGPLAPLFSHGKRRWEMYHDREHMPPLQKEIAELEQRVISTVADPVVRAIYVNTIHDLARNMNIFKSLEVPYAPDITDAFVWVFADLDPFLIQLRAQTQESIAIMAHFGVMMRVIENHWWLEGWSFLLLAKAWDVLDEEHKLWVRWPIEQIGWVPP
ncbi:hypothetical protein BROUX41_004135 [Berkeleyomyces rouxiae]|uniref:uncharacterized protein n=1 Tax=Berkeleyomyces rouxiae TaxID=2035830 RepID=UPI003B8175FB